MQSGERKKHYETKQTQPMSKNVISYFYRWRRFSQTNFFSE